MIKLVNDTVDKTDIDQLILWLQGKPRLTKGPVTLEFEQKWSEWLGVKYSVFVNSGSSANLAATYALLLAGNLRNKKIIVPAVSWVTTVSPVIQLGMIPILCDCNTENLGLDLDHLKQIIKEEDPASLILVHVLGFSNDMKEIMELCHKNNIKVIEDTCEALGSSYDGSKLGGIGDLGTFSLYFGHHISTIEGGLISTNNEELYNTLLMIRSHGWDRDLPEHKRESLRNKYNVSEFNALYTFYHPAFNLRSTDLQAFLGLEQLKKVDEIVRRRNENYITYDKLIRNVWKIKAQENSFVSNFNYPIITTSDKFSLLVEALQNNFIETRPLICGSINQQPFWYERFGKSDNVKNADFLHKHGLYLPNNHELKKEEIEFICGIVNKILK
jgi:CDP-6-deoxy-D-xylo-4-hexulose-3-dehydrase